MDRRALVALLLIVAGIALLVFRPVEPPRLDPCPPYYECNGPPDTRHPRCCF